MAAVKVTAAACLRAAMLTIDLAIVCSGCGSSARTDLVDAAGANTDADAPDADAPAPDADAAAADTDAAAPVADASEVGGAACEITCAGRCVDGRCLITLASNLEQPYGVAVDDANVYWTTNVAATGVVMKVPRGGGTPVILASGLDFPHTIAVDATSVYWTNSIPGTGAVMKVAIAGGTPQVLAAG